MHQHHISFYFNQNIMQLLSLKHIYVYFEIAVSKRSYNMKMSRPIYSGECIAYGRANSKWSQRRQCAVRCGCDESPAPLNIYSGVFAGKKRKK